MVRRKVPKQPTLYELLTKEVIPRLKTVEGDVSHLKIEVSELRNQLTDVKQEVHEAGINGHSALLKEFLEDEAAKKKKGQAYRVVGNDIKGRLAFLGGPREIIRKTTMFVTAAATTAYISAMFWGKVPPPPWPFH